MPSERARVNSAVHVVPAILMTLWRSMRPHLALVPAILVAAATIVAGRSGAIGNAFSTWKAALSATDVLALDAGAAVMQTLATPVREELAYVGMVYVDAPTDRFIDRFRDIVQFEHGPGVPQIGRFSDPPRIEDLESLTLPATDVAALAQCRPARCDVKLSAEAMRRFQDEVNWSGPNVVHQANILMRAMILDLVARYRADGNAALGHYDDGAESLSVAEQFRAILASRDPLPAPVPALLTYLDGYPRGRPAGADEFFYWTVVDFGLKRTLRVNHVTIYPLAPGTAAGVAYVIAIKQLYASHYFHTTLELRFLADDDRHAGEHRMSLVSITRSRSDGMTGFKGLFLRPVISRRSRAAVRGYLEHVKQQVERPPETR
jgi:hypothetical protein